MEIAYGQIIKIIIGILVLVAVVLGAVLGFRNYIIPYFSDVAPTGEDRDLGAIYYQDLFSDSKNLVAREVDGLLSIRSDAGFVETPYYVSEDYVKRRERFLGIGLFDRFNRDSVVGSLDEFIISIDSSWLQEDPVLKGIDGGEWIISEVWREGGLDE